jgi:hypothetical protein
MKDDDAIEPRRRTPAPLRAVGAWNRADDMSDDDDAAPWAQVAPAPPTKYQEEEDDARRVLSDKRPDADVMSEYLTNQVADNPEYERAVEAAFMAEEDKVALACNRPVSSPTTSPARQRQRQGEQQRRLAKGYTDLVREVIRREELSPSVECGVRGVVDGMIARRDAADFDNGQLRVESVQREFNRMIMEEARDDENLG